MLKSLSIKTIASPQQHLTISDHVAVTSTKHIQSKACNCSEPITCRSKLPCISRFWQREHSSCTVNIARWYVSVQQFREQVALCVLWPWHA